ncbi:hypothetical protein ACFOMD_04755 [Sphingoaurantiacus capsulatus]|uniref:Uncharacterized protein n=1 Tax=Sphingoaurantiacus capsulatus TaxID=1771310 RepID=A0ABV7X782_9SPHN
MKRAAALALLLAAAVPARAQQQLAAADPIPAPPPPAAAVDLAEEEVLLFELTLDRATLSDSIQAYERNGVVLLPIGELTRLLDLNVDVLPRERRIVGRLGNGQRSLLVDLATGTARVDGRNFTVPAGAADVALTDIFLSVKFIEQILPLRIVTDHEALVVALTATEELPIQAKLARSGRMRELRPDIDVQEDLLWAGTKPGLWSLPGFDIALESSLEATSPRFRYRYDIRAGADLLYMGFQGYVGSDERGRPTASRFTFERRDRDRGLLGPLRASRFGFGDVYTPSLALGPRSVGGRGIAITSAPLEQTSVFDRVDLRGELPIGYDVELYINDVLRGGQQTPVQGRYEFLSVPLVRGVNVIRIVSYGPRGERSEETRVINVAGGALAKGETTVEVGAVEQDVPLVDLRGDDGLSLNPGVGALRVTANVAHGLTETLTVVGGMALYAPSATDGGDRKLGTLGLRTSLLGYAVQLDAAHDDEGGRAAGLGVAGTPLGVSTILRHVEYGGGFIDESLPTGGDGRELVRHSEATFDFSVGPTLGLTFPFSLRAQRDEFADGRVALIGGFRTSTTTKVMLLSAGVDFDRTTLPGGAPTIERWVGNFAASSYGLPWQLRGTVDYDLVPDLKVTSASITADRNISEKLALRFGVGHSFGGSSDTSFQASAILRLPFADLSFAGDYVTPRDEWRVGVQLAFGLVHDPFAGRYRMTRPGPGIGGNAALRAFIDRDGDDRFDPKIDEPVAGVALTGGGEEAVTGESGTTLVTGLGYASTARLEVNLDNIDNPYVASPPSTIEFTPRAGVVSEILYPLKPVGEVLARVRFRDGGGRLTGLSSVKVRAVREDGKVTEATTEFDGSVVFERLPTGRYTFELDTAQASRLGMTLTGKIAFAVPPDGGFVPDVLATVEFARAEKPAQ